MLDVKEKALKAISPIVPATNESKAEKNFLFNAQKTESSKDLPPYYMIYFLLVELLGFKNLGQFEKISWSVPIDYNGKAFLIEHRKFGVGIFARDASAEAEDARNIANLIKKGVIIAQPFFEKMAEDAAKKSELNVVNNSCKLFGRFSYFLDEYRDQTRSAQSKEINDILKEGKLKEDPTIVLNWLYSTNESDNWLALAVIDSFFSWTEHVFIHIAILNGSISTGVDVSELARKNWSDKYKIALPLSDAGNKNFYDELIVIRQQIRNFIAHGAFGKQGEALTFHSKVGAVPIIMGNKKQKFSISSGLGFENDKAINIIEQFIKHLWSDNRAPARIYIQESELPLILTMVLDGKYKEAMKSVDNMKQLVEYLSTEQERAWNMDW